jgi:membrane protease YdiL (CAAX protease family)
MPPLIGESVPPSEGAKRPAVGLNLLALFSLLLAAFIWVVSLVDSVQRPSVDNVLEQRQLELQVLAAQGPAAELLQPLAVEQPERKLLESLANGSGADSSSTLIQRALLELQLGQARAAADHLSSVLRGASAPERPLAQALLKGQNNQGQPLPPLPDRPVYRQLTCRALGRPPEECVPSAMTTQASWRLGLVNLLPLLGVISGLLLLAQGLWRRWRGRLNPQPILVGPDLTLMETTLVIAGGFVVLGELLAPLVTMPLVNGVLNLVDISGVAKAGAAVLGYYSFTALPALLILWLLLRQRGPIPEGGWLQWRWSSQCLPQGARGLLLSLPPVALMGWLVTQFWQNAGGSNPLLEQVLDSHNGAALACLALTAVLLAPLFEELLFRGVLLPAVGKHWGAPAGIGVSAVTFALAHLSLSEALPLLALGLGLGWLRYSSGRLMSCVVMHSLWNGFTFLNLLLLGS